MELGKDQHQGVLNEKVKGGKEMGKPESTAEVGRGLLQGGGVSSFCWRSY